MPARSARRSLRRLAAPVAASVLFAVAGGPLSGCAGGPRPRTAEQPAGNESGAPANPLAGLNTELQGMTIRHQDWAELGYRWDWANKPVLGRGASVRFIDPDEDVLVVQDTRGVLTVMEPRSGRVRFAEEYGTPRMRFVGNARYTVVESREVAPEVVAAGLLALGQLDLSDAGVSQGQLERLRPGEITASNIDLEDVNVRSLEERIVGLGQLSLWSVNLTADDFSSVDLDRLGLERADPNFRGPASAGLQDLFRGVDLARRLKLEPRTVEIIGRQLLRTGGMNLDMGSPATAGLRQLNFGPFGTVAGEVRQDSVVVTSDAEMFVVDLTNGTLLGRSRFERVVNTAPAIVGEIAVHGTPVGIATRTLIESGTPLPGYTVNGAITADPLRIAGNVVAVVSQAGDVLFMDATTAQATGRAKMSGGVANQPATDGSRLYVASLDQSVYAFTPDGRQVWRYRTQSPITAQPSLYGGMVHVTIPGEGFTALDANTGRVRWQRSELGGEVVAVRDGRLLVLDGERITLLDAQRGDVVAAVDVPGVQRIAADRFVDGNLYVVSEAGEIARFLPR